MTYFVQCTNPYSKDTNYVGPFDDRLAAEIYIEIPLDSIGISRCERVHTILEMQTPRVNDLTFSRVLRLIDEQRAAAKAEATTELARRSQPFAMSSTGEVPKQNLNSFELTNGKILTIKELRTRFPGLGLKEATEIVENWIEDYR